MESNNISSFLFYKHKREFQTFRTKMRLNFGIYIPVANKGIPKTDLGALQLLAEIAYYEDEFIKTGRIRR